MLEWNNLPENQDFVYCHFSLVPCESECCVCVGSDVWLAKPVWGKLPCSSSDLSVLQCVGFLQQTKWTGEIPTQRHAGCTRHMTRADIWQCTRVDLTFLCLLKSWNGDQSLALFLCLSVRFLTPSKMCILQWFCFPWTATSNRCCKRIKCEKCPLWL